MTANKMPEMPAIRRAFYCIDSGRACETDQHEWPESPGFRNVLLITPAELAAHERACYLAGIADAKAIIESMQEYKPVSQKCKAAKAGHSAYMGKKSVTGEGDEYGWIHTVTTLTALEQEAKK